MKNNMIPLNKALKDITPLKDMLTSKPLDLYTAIDEYMQKNVDGKQFAYERDFEMAVRKILKNSGFDIPEKQNIKNTKEDLINEDNSANIDSQIPDIVVKSAKGLVFLELKFQRELNRYIDDLKKVKAYLDEKKCSNAGVLFLDQTEKHFKGWKRCNKNETYSYLWCLGIEKIESALNSHLGQKDQNHINDLIEKMK